MCSWLARASRSFWLPLCSCVFWNALTLPALRSTHQATGPAGTSDAIHRVPLERWDLDQAEALQGDALTLAAQVSWHWLPSCMRRHQAVGCT